MRIGVDLDGVCYDFVGALREWLVSQGHRLKELPEAMRWNFFEDWGLTLAEFKAQCAGAVDAGTLWLEGKPIDGSLDTLHRLKAGGDTIHIVTNRAFGHRAESNTMAWLREHEFPYDSVTFTADKTAVNVDVMIDDSPDNIEALQCAGIPCVVFDQKWNRHIEATRAYGWNDAIEVLIEMARTNSATPRPPTSEQRYVDPDTGGEKGIKLARFDLLPAGPLRQLAEHYGKGAEKYDDRNWEKGYPWSLSFAALNRHLWAWQDGEDRDAETGSHHMAAIAFHALALLEFADSHPELDDRPRKS